jgi:Fe-S cluster assembly protein SufD
VASADEKDIGSDFENLFQSHVAREAGSPQWLMDLRHQSLAAFRRLGLPTRRNEDWRYTSTRSLVEGSFRLSGQAASISAEALAYGSLPNAARLVCVDGIYDPSLSSPPEGLEVSSLQHAKMEDEPVIRSILTSTESLPLLNQAFFSDGLLIKVREGLELDHPIQLLYIQTDTAASMLSPRSLILVESQARVVFLESHYGKSGHFTNAVSDIFVKDGAECRHVLERIQGSENTFVGAHTFHVGRDARVESFNLAVGGRLNRSQLEFRMTAEGATARLDGLCMAPDQSHIDNVTEVIHSAPHTSSAQLYKAVLEGKSRVVFNGKITIAKQAQKVDAQQLNKNLLMSPDAEVDSRPQLAIDANDVKCSHGATIGQINAQELFYLQSRGISKEDAQKMLAKAFIGDVMGRIKLPALKSHLETSLDTFGSRV